MTYIIKKYTDLFPSQERHKGKYKDIVFNAFISKSTLNKAKRGLEFMNMTFSQQQTPKHHDGD